LGSDLEGRTVYNLRNSLNPQLVVLFVDTLFNEPRNRFPESLRLDVSNSSDIDISGKPLWTGS
jgi:hypothetical protein